MADHSLWLLEYGFVDCYPASNLFAAQPSAAVRRMPFCFGLVRSTDRCVLVDTGFDDPARWQLLLDRYGPGRWARPTEVLGRALVDPAEVEAIVLTHGDFDHAGCVRHFPNAHVYIQREEVAAHERAAALPGRFGYLTRYAEPGLPQAIEELSSEGRLTLLDGEAEIADGIRVIPAFGAHTAGSQAVVVENAFDGRWIFAGDLVYVHENVEGIGHDGVLAPIGLSTGSSTTWLHAVDGLLDAVRRNTRRLLPFHDADAWERYPSRTYDDGLHVAEVTLAGGHESTLDTPARPRGEAP